MERIYRTATLVLSALILLLGLALLVTTLVGGGGPLARGVVIGAALALLGGARVYIAVGGFRERERA